jgi:hypothetical protein
MTLRKKKIFEFVRGSTRLHSLEGWLWKTLWTCHKTDNAMNKALTLSSFTLCSHKHTLIWLYLLLLVSNNSLSGNELIAIEIQCTIMV